MVPCSSVHSLGLILAEGSGAPDDALPTHLASANCIHRSMECSRVSGTVDNTYADNSTVSPALNWAALPICITPKLLEPCSSSGNFNAHSPLWCCSLERV